MAKKATPPKAVKKAPAEPPKPKGTGRDLAKVWNERLTSGNKTYDAWAAKYRVKDLDEYYCGHQWPGLSDSERLGKYVINLTFATVEDQLPSLMLSRPKVTVEARPDHADTPESKAGARATMIEQTLQTFIDDPKLHFNFLTTLALRDAYARYGLIEVGYTADWIDNPNAGKPLLKEDDSPLLDDEEQPITQPKRIIKPGSKESLFLNRLVPENFRVSPGRNLLEHNDWVAYGDWFYLEDVKKNPDYQNTADLKATGMISTQPDATSDDTDRELHAGQVRIWKIWDFRKKVRHVLAEGHAKMLQEDKPFTVFPVLPMKFYEKANSWYPLPPIFNWLSPQDEINESREMQKVHRRRAARRYMREPSVKSEEFEKLESGEDMVCIEVPKVNPSPIVPIPDAPLDGAIFGNLEVSHQDFQRIAGASGEAQGVPNAPTATQANIVNVRAQVREAAARQKVANWLGEIVRVMLLTIRERMQLPMMVKRTVDPFAPVSKETLASANAWYEVKSEDIDQLDVDIKIDVSSLSPVAQDSDRQAWNVVLQLLTNQALLMILMTPNPDAPTEPSPLLRKTLTLYGIKSDQEIREIWRVGQAALQMILMQQAMAAAAKTSGGTSTPGGAASPGIPAGPTTGTPAPGAPLM